jgi:serine/threonine protein kinase
LESRKLLEEAVRLAQVSGHDHILGLVGVVLDDGGGPLLVIVSYCEHGNLLDYLTQQKAADDQTWMVQAGRQIACGMVHLVSRGFIHRDLAARNVLVDGHKRLRIADFGMSRQVCGSGSGLGAAGGGEDPVYQITDVGTTAVPLRWTAPEAYSDGVYTEASDVWSFGIVLLEIYSEGAVPYDGLMSVALIHRLESGYVNQQIHTHSHPD